MNLADSRLKELDNPSLTHGERARLRYNFASDLISAGRYADARAALGELWRGIGERPNVEGLDERTAAEVLLQVGALSGWIGASEQAEGAQGKAKDLISESAAQFETLGETVRAALARSDLALCYWREGAYDEARILLTKAYEDATDAEPKLKVLLRWVTVEYSAGRYNDALILLRESARVFDESDNDALKGNFHNLFALVMRRLGTAEGRADYLDRAIIEYTAAVYHYERTGNERYKATNENNLAFLLYRLGRYEEAHEQLDRAAYTLTRLKDAGLLAQVDETRARVLIAEQKYAEASRTLGGVMRTLERGGASALLAEAYTSQGVAWARVGSFQSSLNILRRAVSLAEEAGALSNAARAALTLIEEHGARRLSEDELFSVYLRADELLRGAQNCEDAARLRACAHLVVGRLAGFRLTDRNFSLHGAVHSLEARFIGQALDETGGSVARAAKLLGVGYQSLINMLNTRHKKLLPKRTPPKKRKRSIMQKPEE